MKLIKSESLEAFGMLQTVTFLLHWQATAPWRTHNTAGMLFSRCLSSDVDILKAASRYKD